MAKPASQARRIAIVFALFVGVALVIITHQSSATPTSPTDKRSDTTEHFITPAAEPVGPIIIHEPADSATVDRDFTVSGVSATTSGLIEWELRFEGMAIDSGSTYGGEHSPDHFEFLVRAPAPGTYEIALFESRGSHGGYSKLSTRTIHVA